MAQEIEICVTETGIAKRALPGVELLAIKSPDDLALVGEFAARHAGTVA